MSRFLRSITGRKLLWPLLLLLIALSCRPAFEIRPNGIGYYKLGDELPEDDKKRVKGHAIRDTLFREQDFSWRAKILSFRKGPVYLEGDFTGQNRINRIRVESPALSYREELRVGMTVAELKNFAPRWFVTYLPDYGVWDLTHPDTPSIHYLVAARGEQQGEAASIQSIDALDPEAPIVMIVIM
jgi:hypothetical protein